MPVNLQIILVGSLPFYLPLIFAAYAIGRWKITWVFLVTAVAMEALAIGLAVALQRYVPQIYYP